MINVLFAASDEAWQEYHDVLEKAFAAQNLNVHLSQQHAADQVDYIVYAPSSRLQDFTPYTKCKAVLSLWAGVEKIVVNETLTQPLCRMVDPGLTQSMVEWVSGHVLRYHLGIDENLAHQDGTWRPSIPPLAKDRHVTVLGLGALGAACASMLAQIGFQVSGWSRNPKNIPDIDCFNGKDGLDAALKTAEILVLLLPDTPGTTNTLNAETLAKLPRGARVLNPGRGPLIEDEALLAALDSGHIAHATLDVFRTEPLTKGHAYWRHPNVTVTPHIAAATRAETAANVIVDNIHRCENGQPLRHLVNRNTGY